MGFLHTPFSLIRCAGLEPLRSGPRSNTTSTHRTTHVLVKCPDNSERWAAVNERTVGPRDIWSAYSVDVPGVEWSEEGEPYML